MNRLSKVPLAGPSRLPTVARRSTATLLHKPASRELHVSAHTILNPTPTAIESHLSSLALSPRSAVLFSPSTSLDLASLPSLISPFGHLPSAAAAVGAFHSSPTPALAIASFTPETDAEDVSAFYVPDTGRGPAEVGRWQRIGTDWNEHTLGNTVGALEEATKEGWDSLWAPEDTGAVLGPQRKEDVTAILAMTDGTPAPVLTAMDEYSSAVKLGLVSAPTPFLTGRPHTLFHGGQTYSVGTVGLVLSRTPAPAMDVEYGVDPLDQEYVVETCRGNLLLSLIGAPNPTQMLIAALQKRDANRKAALTKEEDFFLSISDPLEPGVTSGGDRRRIVRILSGDPSRGSLGVDSELPLRPGQVVQFMQRAPGFTPSAAPTAPGNRLQLQFAVLPRSDAPDAYPSSDGAAGPQVLDGFTVASERGLVYAAPTARTSVCAVSGAMGTACW